MTIISTVPERGTVDPCGWFQPSDGGPSPGPGLGPAPFPLTVSARCPRCAEWFSWEHDPDMKIEIMVPPCVHVIDGDECIVARVMNL